MRLTLKSLHTEMQTMTTKLQEEDRELHTRVDALSHRTDTLEMERKDYSQEFKLLRKDIIETIGSALAPHIQTMEKMADDAHKRLDAIDKRLDDTNNILSEHIKEQEEYNRTHDRITIDHEGRIKIIEAQVRKDKSES
jgi:hypothetical protein